MIKKKTPSNNKIMKDMRRDYQLYLFLLIPVTIVFVFRYLPMFGIFIAFQDFSFRKGVLGSEWVGLKHFVRFFNNYACFRIIKNTLVLSLYSIIAGFPVPIVFALVLNSLRNERVKKIIQNITVMPHFISTVVIVGILMQVMNSRTGIYGMIGEALTGEYPPDLFGSGFRHLYVWSGVWQGFGWGSIIYTAALANVPPEYHEAAMIDGASPFQRVKYIDLPAITPMIVTMLILRTGSIMSVGFEKVLLMQNGLNLRESDVISTYVYAAGLQGGDLSYGTAIGLFNSVVNLLIIVSVNWFARKVGETSLW